MSDPSRDLQLLPQLPSDLVAVPNADFVEKALDRLGLTLRTAEKERFVMALTQGVNKSRIWQTLASRSLAAPPSQNSRLPSYIMASTPAIVVDDLLIGFAPDDDAAFVDQVFRRLQDREPTALERNNLLTMLSGDGDRRAALNTIAALSTEQNPSPVRTRIVRSSPLTLLNEANGNDICLVRYIGDGDYLVSDQVQMTMPLLQGTEWRASVGRLLSGPLQGLAPGLWELDIDIKAPPSTTIDLSIIANGGFDTLSTIRLVGTSHLKFQVSIEQQHVLCELTMDVQSADRPEALLSIRKLTLRRITGR